MKKIIDVSEYCKILENKKSDVFIFVFSGANLPAKKFNYLRALSSVENNFFFLNDTLDRYYQEGIKGIGDLQESITFFKKFIVSQGHKNPKIFTFGCSMGGYGALLYGSLLSANSTLTFSPSYPRYCSVLWQTPYYQDVSCKAESLIDVIMDTSSSNQIYYGDRGIGDVCSHLIFRDIKGCSTIYKNTCHALIYIVVQYMDLSVVIDRFKNNSLNLDQVDTLSAYSNFTFLDRAIYIGNLYFDRSRVPNAFEITNAEKITGPIASALSELYLKTDIVKSKELLFLAMKNSINIRILRLIYSSLELDDVERVYRIIVKTLSLNPGLYGYDSNEKFYIGEVLLKSFDAIKRKDSIHKARNTNVEGYFDKFDGEFIHGWAVGVGGSEIVSVLLNNKYLGSADCTHSREDLKKSGKGVNGTCAFKFLLNADVLVKGSNNTVQVISSTGQPLTYSNSLVCPSMYFGVIDSIRGFVIKGWLINYIYRRTNIEITIHLNGVESSKMKLGDKRPDLLKKGFSLHSGFTIDLSDHLLLDGINVIDIYANNERVFKNIVIKN
jgi:hypothetical protein